MLDFEKTLDQLGALTLLKFFPADPGARLELAKLVARMAANEDQVDWLVNRTLALVNEWPGPRVLRQIFCSKFKPADGIEVGATAEYPEGVPSEKGLYPPPSRPALPAGHVASADKELDEQVKKLVQLKRLQ